MTVYRSLYLRQYIVAMKNRKNMQLIVCTRKYTIAQTVNNIIESLC